MTSSSSAIIEEGTLANRKGGAPQLAYRLTIPATPRAAMLVVHGYGEHSVRYRRVVDRWTAAGIATATMDLRGHGWSDGIRGHCERFSEFHADVAEMLAVVARRLPETNLLPPFAFGHSFGGLIVATYALDNPAAFRGIALTSPFFGTAFKVPRVKELAATLASRFFPALALPTGLKGSSVTHDEAIARDYDTDPRINKNATARWYTESVAAQRDLYTRAPQLRTPLLLVQAGGDLVASAPDARAIFDRVGSSDKVFDERAGLYHEVLNEPLVGDTIADDISRWIVARA